MRASNVGDGALDGARADREAALREQALDDDRIAGRRSLIQRPRYIAPRICQTPARRSDLVPRRNRLSHIAPHRIDRDTELADNRFLAEPATSSRPNRGHHLAVDHQYLPCRRYQHIPLALHPNPPWRGIRISVERGSIDLPLYMPE